MNFYFDFISPFAYLAWRRVHAVAERHGREVVPVPVLLAGILGAHGTKGPAEVPAKRRWVYKDAIRSARAMGVPFGPPPTHPFNPLLALRVAGEPMAAPVRRKLIDALYLAVWGGGGTGVEDPAAVAAICERSGLDGAAVVEAAGRDAAKARLKADTERAVADGVFGVPTIVVDGELFWGADRLDHVDRFLGGEQIADAELARWAEVRPSASRRGI